MKKQSFILFFILSIITMNGQTEMLIGQISGRTIVRENFDKDGMLLNKQTFKAGKIIKEDRYYQIEVITELFNDKEKSEEKYTTTYRCKPDEASIMVMACLVGTVLSGCGQVQENMYNRLKFKAFTGRLFLFVVRQVHCPSVISAVVEGSIGIQGLRGLFINITIEA